MRDRYLKNAIEAALLAAGHPVPLEQLLEMFGERDRPEPAEIRAALEQLAQEYADRGIELREVASGFRIQVRRNVTEVVGRLLQERRAPPGPRWFGSEGPTVASDLRPP